MKTERTATTIATKTDSELAELMGLGAVVLFDGVDELPMVPLIGVAEEVTEEVADEVLVAGDLLGVAPAGILLGVAPAGVLPAGVEDRRTGQVFLV